MPPPSSPPPSPREWAELLGRQWEERARSPSRDLFVASHPGWRDPEVWERYARTELELFLSNLADDRLATADVLEIGCGSGRLVPLLRPRVASYTGFDIAPGMVEAAARRCAGMDGVRFFVGDGLGVPEAARDRRYDLALAVAVFIHCPREVIAANLRSAYEVLAPGGELRLQVLADPEDPTGVPDLAASEQVQSEVQDVVVELSDEERRLTHDTYYMGHAFRYDELEPFLIEHTGGEVALYRGDLAAIYALVRKS